MVRMGPEEECISCEISTARASHRKKEPHTGGTYPGEYIFLDILHPVVPVGFIQNSTFPFYLILVDAYSRYACIYGLRDKSSTCVIDTLTRYQADHGHVGNYGYLDIARIQQILGASSRLTNSETIAGRLESASALQHLKNSTKTILPNAPGTPFVLWLEAS